MIIYKLLLINCLLFTAQTYYTLSMKVFNGYKRLVPEILKEKHLKVVKVTLQQDFIKVKL